MAEQLVCGCSGLEFETDTAKLKEYKFPLRGQNSVELFQAGGETLL
jgi:hypothetical protein